MQPEQQSYYLHKACCLASSFHRTSPQNSTVELLKTLQGAPLSAIYRLLVLSIMAKFKSISIASVVISSLSSSVNAWIDSNIGVNLSYPPLENYGNSITNGQVLPNSTTDITGWPCHSWPLPASNPVLRVPFFTSGRVTFALKNDTVGSQQGFDYSVYPYIGEIGFGNGTYTVPSLGKANGMQEGYYFDGATGYSSLQDKTECFQWDMPKAVTRALGLDKPLTAADLVGMEATIGVRIVSAGPAKTTVDTLYVPNAVEEMYQVRIIPLLLCSREIRVWSVC